MGMGLDAVASLAAAGLTNDAAAGADDLGVLAADSGLALVESVFGKPEVSAAGVGLSAGTGVATGAGAVVA